MDDEFIYWRHSTPVGIQVEEVCGAESRKGEVWRQMARQVYCENGREAYRDLGHFEGGAPFLYNDEARISLTDTDHFLAVATLPRTPEVHLAEFSPRTAMGIDAERWDREQVLRVRDRYLSDAEQLLAADDDLAAHIQLWTAKEAMLKAIMHTKVDIREELTVTALPEVDKTPALPGHKARTGKGIAIRPDGEKVELELYCYDSEGCCVTIAYSSKCAKFAVK